MFEINTNSLTKFALAVPCFALLVACSSKQVQNAALEPIDLPAEETSSYMTPEPEAIHEAASEAPAPKRHAKKFKSKKKTKIAKSSKRKNKEAGTAIGSVSKNTPPTPPLDPIIGESQMTSVPIAVEPMAPPVPFDNGLESSSQPNWWIASLVIAGLVGAIGVAFRVRRQSVSRKRSLVFNA